MSNAEREKIDLDLETLRDVLGETTVHSVAIGALIGRFLKDINRIADAIDVAADMPKQ
jgi:hypothetical protein